MNRLAMITTSNVPPHRMSCLIHSSYQRFTNTSCYRVLHMHEKDLSLVLPGPLPSALCMVMGYTWYEPCTLIVSLK